MQMPPLPPAPRNRWLWLWPYIAIGAFAAAMLAVTALLQWREMDTARSALEGDMHWAERTIETRLRSHQDFMEKLAHEQETGQLNYEEFQKSGGRYVLSNPDILTLLWVNTDGRIDWVAPYNSGIAFAGESLTGVRRTAMREAFRSSRPTYSENYTDRQLHLTDLIIPVRRGGADVGALVAIHSLDALLYSSLPSWFSSKYSLTLLDSDDEQILSNSTVTPTNRNISGAIRLNLLETELKLQVIAYRTVQAWLPYVPAVLITILTLVTAGTLIQLRRHAQRNAETERQLRDAYSFRQAMSQSLITGLRATDMNGKIIFVNAAFCRMVGVPEEELIGRVAPFPYWPPEEVDSLQRSLDLTLAGKAPPSGMELRVMHRSGTRFDVRTYVSPLIDATGRQLGWMASMNDITEPKRVRVELEQAHERFLTVLNGLDSAVHVADVVTGEILFANRTFLNIFGSDAVGRISGVVTAACQPPAHNLARNPATLKAEDLPCVLYDGELQHALNHRWYQLHDRAIRWVDGRTVRIQILGDITEKKHIADMTQEQQRRMDESSRLISMGEMASSLAHELNQPLSAIANYASGCVKRLQSGNYNNDDLLAAMQKAADQAQRAGKIIRRMRDMVKKSEPQRQPLALADLIDEMRALTDIEAGRADVAIEVDLPPDLPRIMGDRISIEQVLHNLTKNGIEAMQQTPPEARKLRITAQVLEGRMIEVAVADWGIGLKETDLEKVFTPFYTTKEEGMGIGLAICRSIVEFHQGRLWPEANPEGGTVFRFTLPMEEVE